MQNQKEKNHTTVCSYHITFQLQDGGVGGVVEEFDLKSQFAFHVADTPVTLKQGQGYQIKVITMQSLKDLTVFKKKAMLKFLSNQEQVTYL